MNEQEESSFLKSALGTQKHRFDVADGGQPPIRLFPYWGWLVTRTHTEAVEFLLALLSLWFASIFLGLLQIDEQLWSPLILAMDHIVSVEAWTLLLFVGVFLSIVGLAFRIGVLRLAGLLISVGFWLTLAGVTASVQFYSPSWGGYAIIGVSSAWAFIRTMWVVTDRVANWLRRKLEARGHVRSTKHE